MHAARRDQSQSETVITIVGDDEAGALAEALRRRGPTVRHRAVTDSRDMFARGPVLAVGIAAADGGATLRRRLGPDATLIVVLPAESVSARLEAFRLGARVVDATVASETAQSVVEHLETGGHQALGWVRTEDLIEAVAARLLVRLGTGRGDRTQIRLGDGRELADALDRFGDAVSALSLGTRVMDAKPVSSPPPSDAAVSDLDWEDDPQTMKADLAEVEQYRRLAQSDSPPERESARDASGVVATARGRARDLSLELGKPPVDQGEPPPRSSMIRALRPKPGAPPAGEPVITLASNASSIELPALPGDLDAFDAPLPAVLDPFAPAGPPVQRTLEETVPRVSSPMVERWKSESRPPLRLEAPETSRLSTRHRVSAAAWLLLFGLAGVGAVVAWWLFAG